MATSQIRTVPSSLPVASQLPSGATATAPTTPVWPVRMARCSPGGHVPDPHRPVPAAGGQPAAIRRHRHRPTRVGVAGQDAPERGSARSGSGHRLTSRGGEQLGQGGDLRPPVRVLGDPAVQDIHAPAAGPARCGGQRVN